MKKFSKPIGRLLAVLALLALAQFRGDSVIGDAGGKDFTTCVQTCNSVYSVCATNCQDDCRALYPSNKTLRDACISACKVQCNVELDDCKMMCQAVHHNPSPEAP
jgi:hypothetical protein